MFGVNAFAGTVGTYTSMMKLQFKWEHKKENQAYTEKPETNEDPIIRQLNEMREKKQENSSKEAIINKMNSGKKLSQQELEYLQKEDPAAYQKAKEIMAEQQSYENALKKCRTKEDVQRLKATHMGVTMAKVNAIANNPNIPEGKKMELLVQENAKMDAVRKTEMAFVGSGRYESLPTDAEKREEMKRIQKSLKEKSGAYREPATEDVEIDPQPADMEKDPMENEVAEGEEAAVEGQEAEQPKKQKEAAPADETRKQNPKADHTKGRDAYRKVVAEEYRGRKREKVSKKV